ncbi:MAG: PorT family protein [Bacteroidaceae bacterium]|nr:PorT family protein [Bacteroidaceae bacterium]
MNRNLSATLLALLMTVFSSSASAQIGEKRTDFSIGFNAGFMMNKMDIQPRIKQSYKNFPTIGFTARYVCEKYFTSICAVQIEANYANLGWKEFIEDGTGNTYSRDLSYIQIPMLMQMGWGYEEKGCKFIFEAGPQIGINIGSTEHFGGGEWDPSHRPNNVYQQYGMEVDNKVDYGITGGLGVELSTPIGHFLLSGRYYYGLGDVFDNSKKGTFTRSAHQTIVAKLTYLFDIVKTKRD